MNYSDIFKIRVGSILKGVITGERTSARLSQAVRMSDQHLNADAAKNKDILIKVSVINKIVVRADRAKFGIDFRDTRGKLFYIGQNSKAELVDMSQYAEVKKTVEHWDIIKIEGWYCPLPSEVAGGVIHLIKRNGGIWWEASWRGNHFLIRDGSFIVETEETDGYNP